MSVVSIWIIAGLLKIALADGSLSISQFIRATDGECHPVCSVNEPSAITYDVRRRVSCLLEHCVPTETCPSANRHKLRGTQPDTFLRKNVNGFGFGIH